jgi:hypothetical protein
MDEFGLREQLNDVQQLLDQAEEQARDEPFQLEEELGGGRVPGLRKTEDLQRLSRK